MKHFAVIGSPVEHSLSPIMHKWVFDSLKIDAQYEKIIIEDNELQEIIHKMKHGKSTTRSIRKSFIKLNPLLNAAYTKKK